MTTLVTDIAEATDQLLATTRTLTDARTSSVCEGWTRGHVLTHLARNADALTGVIRGVLDGPRVPMYASQESRDADVNEGAGRDLPSLLADVQESAGTLASELPRITEDTEATFERVPGGTVVDVRLVPYMRLREVVFHHVDLDAGFTFADVHPDQLLVFLRDAVHRLDTAGVALTLRTDVGDELVSGADGPVVTGTRAGCLTWLARRDPSGVATSDGLPPLPFGG